MSLSDVIDQFLNKHSFSDTGTTEKSNFTTSGVRSQQVDDFDTSDQKVSTGTLVFEARGISMDRVVLFGINWTTFINRFTNDIHDATQSFRADGHFDRRSQVIDCLASDQTVSGIQSNSSDSGVPEMLSDF